jgi:hypothetical protein
VVTEVLRPRSGSSGLVADLSQILGEVAGLISDGVFHGTSGGLTSVASHYPTLDFGVVGRGYAVGLFADQLCELGQSLVPVATAIIETTTVEWVKEARCMEREAIRGLGGVQSTEAGSSTIQVEPALDQGNPPVNPATQLLSSASSSNADETPQ